MRVMPGQGLMFDGHGLDRADLLAQAREYMLGNGWDPFDADEYLIPRRKLLAQAWFGSEARGFVQEHHDDARPVTMVHVPTPETPADA
jgi:hypothetical protein